MITEKLKIKEMYFESDLQPDQSVRQNQKLELKVKILCLEIIEHSLSGQCLFFPFHNIEMFLFRVIY